MPSFTRELPDIGATRALASSFARALRPGDVVALEGQLGAGKTTFVRALAAGLGVDVAMVSSPTFVFVNQYPIPGSSVNAALAGGELVHVDAYRLTSSDDLETLGWDRLFDPRTRLAAGRAAAVIEWPARIAQALPDPPARVTIESTGATARRMTVELPESWSDRPEAARLADYSPVLCRVRGTWVEPLCPTWPFADEQARLADLHGWFAGSYRTSRPPRDSDLDAGD